MDDYKLGEDDTEDEIEVTAKWGIKGYGSEFYQITSLIDEFLSSDPNQIEAISSLLKTLIEEINSKPKEATKSLDNVRNLFFEIQMYFQNFYNEQYIGIITQLLLLMDTILTKNADFSKFIIDVSDDDPDQLLDSFMKILEDRTDYENSLYILRVGIIFSIIENSSKNNAFILSINQDFIDCLNTTYYVFDANALSSDHLISINFVRILYKYFKSKTYLDRKTAEYILELFNFLASNIFFEDEIIISNCLSALNEMITNHEDLIHMFNSFSIYQTVPDIPCNPDCEKIKFDIFSNSLHIYDEETNKKETKKIIADISASVPMDYIISRLTEVEHHELLFSGLTLIYSKLHFDKSIVNLDVSSLCNLMKITWEHIDLDTKDLITDVVILISKFSDKENYNNIINSGIITEVVDFAQNQHDKCKSCMQIMINAVNLNPEFAKLEMMQQCLDELLECIEENDWEDIEDLGDVLTNKFNEINSKEE
ncbi:armadillo (ARM) repeat-containing protein family [Trichomonas vaginalis G3]|uniref:armadillo (ARM) repeat-containing protein family n=1 Tax=Trichomonas vaginalis (strain ATCC PRA-98 / G3) TaxID=412133 RepID=UPI0021E5988E|nr:armadillo (ARM) repeat-containing protein family [Trichomonas vaginalis G3]KAI5531053.1 armadillo (ARM) repeat-containing protein family [Trichomonas vaginalis G3]